MSTAEILNELANLTPAERADVVLDVGSPTRRAFAGMRWRLSWMNGAAETRQDCRSPASRRRDLDFGREAEALEQFLAVLPAEPKLLRVCQAQPTDNPH